MRKDMAKVIIERPRALNHYAIRRQHKKTGLRIRNYDPNNDYDDSPKRITSSRIKLYGRAAKDMTDLLSPIDRFLRSNIGRPWDQVWSEICEQIDRRNLAQNHLFEHFDGYVETNCLIGEDGEVYLCSRWGGIEPVKDSGGQVFYVHPITGLLCWHEDSVGLTARQKREAKEEARKRWCVAISGKRHYVKLNGIWYVADLEYYHRGQIPPEEEAKMTLINESWNTWRVTNKRQCNRKELKAASLSNDQPA